MTAKTSREKGHEGRGPKSRECESGRGHDLLFVVQKHAASRLHYDFRLELDGVLKSWAVPKGPTLDPAQKRLAMMVEDHPLDYRTFEGVIPKGNYGAGQVIIWDQGTYNTPLPCERALAERKLREGLLKGDLKFRLCGQRLKGEFALVKIRADEENSWLLIKKQDEYSAREDVTRNARSVVSGLTIEDLKAGRHQERSEPADDQILAALETAPLAPVPHSVKPMLATLAERPFDDDGWIFEIKLDGYRTVAEVTKESVSLRSRNNLSFNARFPSVADALSAASDEAVYDGELVVLDEQGRSSFQLLQNYNVTGEGSLLYFIFDLIYFNGRDLRNLPLLTRKEILRSIIPDHPLIRFSDHIIGMGTTFFSLARENNLEGIIGKRGSSRYLSGKRSREWLKIKTQLRQEAIICGFTAPRGSRRYFGTLVLGAYDRGKLVCIGHSGGGFDENTLERVHGMLLAEVQPNPPFHQEMKERVDATWVKPVYVCEVAFSEWTDEGLMRHPVFLGLREDKAPSSVVRETPLHLPQKTGNVKKGSSTEVIISGKRLLLTNVDKVFWPREQFRKRDVIDYYRKMAPLILPHLKDRPESLFRTPNGIDQPGFFQKEIGEFAPDWATTCDIFSESNDKTIKYFICQDEADLVYLANLGCIEINPWLSRTPALDFPDYFVIDLDPEEIPFRKVVEAAQAVHEVLRQAEAVSFPKTSGATGIHIYVPLGARYDFDTATAFARIIATMTHHLVPEFTSIERSPSKRQKKVYLDYLQNRKGQTLAAPYSIRPRPGATVSTPLKWEEVTSELDPLQFTITTVPERVRTTGEIFRDVLGEGIDIERCLKLLERVSAAPGHAAGHR